MYLSSELFFIFLILWVYLAFSSHSSAQKVETETSEKLIPNYSATSRYCVLNFSHLYVQLK